MKTPLVAHLCICVFLVSGELSCAQESKSTDKPKEPIAEWIKILTHPEDDSSMMQAREALGPEGPYGKSALAALIDALPDTEETSRSNVLDAISDYGLAAIPELNRALKHKKAAIRASAAKAIGTIAFQDSSVDAVMPLLEALADSDGKVREEAAFAIGYIHRLPEKSVPALTVALRDTNPDVRSAAAWSLQYFNAKSAPAVPALIANLAKHDDASNTVNALAAIGPAAKSAVPALLREFKATKDKRYRSQIAEALGNIGPAAKAAIPALVDAIQGGPDETDSSMIDALGQIGPEAKSAVPILIKLAKNRSNYDHQMRAMQALGRIGPAAKDAVPILLGELDVPGSESSLVSTAALGALGGIGPDAKTAVPTLIKVARNRLRGERERKAAAEAVMKIDPVVAAKEKMETAWLRIRLGKIPEVKLIDRAPATDEQRATIKKLIGDLAGIDDVDPLVSYGWTRRMFVPIADEGAGNANSPKAWESFRTLVEAGPLALPILLESLDDKTPTKAIQRSIGVNFALVYSSEIEWNPLDQIENRVLAVKSKLSNENDGWGSYTMKVGDLCASAIGQIVGRDYAPVRFQGVKIGSILIRAPSENRELRNRLRSIWSSKDATQRLFDSLLLDYSTRGIFNGKTLDGWRSGSEFQIDAAIRLLYYFPKEAGPLIAARLRSLDVMNTLRKDHRDDWIQRDVKNGVSTVEFIKAVKWCRQPAIKTALADIEKRTDDPTILQVLAVDSK